MREEWYQVRSDPRQHAVTREPLGVVDARGDRARRRRPSVLGPHRARDSHRVRSRAHRGSSRPADRLGHHGPNSQECGHQEASTCDRRKSGARFASISVSDAVRRREQVRPLHACTSAAKAEQKHGDAALFSARDRRQRYARLVPGSSQPLQTPRQESSSNAGARILDLITGTAKVGVGAATLAAVEVTSRSIRIARVVIPGSIAEGPLDTVERHLGRRQGEAHRSERENRENVAEAAESVLNRVVVGVVDMLDMEQLIDHVPITKVVARVDLPGVIDEIDLAGVIRESTTGLGAETLHASRAGLMAADLWSARLVDRILRRKHPRDLSVRWNGSARVESATPEVIS
jgi:hypothetical protein